MSQTTDGWVNRSSPTCDAVLRALPYSTFLIGDLGGTNPGRPGKYTANADGIIENVDPNHVGALLRSGCVLIAPWQRLPPEVEVPKVPEPTVVTLTATPHARFYVGHKAYQVGPEVGQKIMYDENGKSFLGPYGLLHVDPTHEKALIKMGCEVVASARHVGDAALAL